ncbi:hypothetical protein N0O92_21955 [Alkalihalobacillus sp. MEB130]|uniref:hypothetical protein n=1 Tax=Alkalihalobacillus sp. MEB130 TaxID=2976704 RepID=UPI0028E02108|nr:hypothetical protein [Alkalihalobacillus sp. MEB130]MDT8862841.1 hypothetical protein [Alkalihalobacillus sp. MEB130]
MRTYVMQTIVLKTIDTNERSYYHYVRTDILIEVKEMIKRFSGQEIFIILAAIFVLLFMYATIILSAPSHESKDNHKLDTYVSYDMKEINESNVASLPTIGTKSYD